MSLQRFENTEIIVPISDAAIQGITLKRKAYVQSINIEVEAKRVAMNIKVVYYGSDEKNGYGDVLTMPGITAYTRTLVADNSTLVDSATGEPICGIEELPNAGNESSPLFSRTYMMEFELFAAMMYQPVTVADLAVAKVQYAASVGRLDI